MSDDLNRIVEQLREARRAAMECSEILQGIQCKGLTSESVGFCMNSINDTLGRIKDVYGSLLVDQDDIKRFDKAGS